MKYEEYLESASYIKSYMKGLKPTLAMVLGTGLGPFSKQIDVFKEIPYGEIPHFPISTAPGHEGKLIIGKLDGLDVLCMCGRFHYYEGYSMDTLNIPVRVLKLLGIETLVLTNAAGAVDTSYNPGDVMIISDHMKFFGSSPMAGTNIPEFGPRFFDVSDMYCKSLREKAKKVQTDLVVHEGVYMYFPGPQFETPAEVRAARILGANAVGMSTVTEALTAAHCGIKVFAMSLITNMAAGITKAPVTGEEVDETASSVEDKFSLYFKAVLKEITKE
ncbi:MAG: purine-nucleoside phosphorylase [Sphaerochaetaceae bacterium]|nr:purine-nucleoside phosphorylase [Sphaerochaetaceae bacterium]